MEGSFVESDRLVMQRLPAAIAPVFVDLGLAPLAAFYVINWVGTRLLRDLRNVMFAKLLAAATA